jgi:putative ABC transport system permease protein
LLIVRNLLRQRIRTGLTVIGMSIGITAVVALGVITHSLRATTSDLLQAGGSDFSIGRANSADFTLSILTEQDRADVEAYPEIEHVTGVLMAISRVGSNPYFVQIGIAPDDLTSFDVPIESGSRLQPGATDEIMLGDEAANQLGARVGDSVNVRDLAFRVVGVYDSGVTYLDGGALLPLQAVRGYEHKEGLYSLFYVRVKPGTNINALAAKIERDNSELATLVNVDDVSDVDQGIQILDAVNLAVTALAIFIGGIAVMNTMVMAVFERTREFGILRALGWRTRRILQMVVGESLVLCLFASILGSAIAVGLTRLIVLEPTVRAFISPEYTYDVFLRGLAVGVGVALLGAIYPAWRAASFSPAQAIRYE